MIRLEANYQMVRYHTSTVLVKVKLKVNLGRK
jgi:hypothetical protein